MTNDSKIRKVLVLDEYLQWVEDLPDSSPFHKLVQGQAAFRQEVQLSLDEWQADITEDWTILQTLWNAAHPDGQQWNDDWMPTCFDLVRWKRTHESWSKLKQKLEQALSRMIETAREMPEELLHRIVFGDSIPELEGVYWTDLSDIEQNIIRVLLPAEGKLTEPEISRKLGREPESFKRLLRRLKDLRVLSHIPKSGYWVRARPMGTPGSAFSMKP